MPMRKRRSSGTLALLRPFIVCAFALVVLTGRHIVATLHHDTIFEAIRRNDADSVRAFLRAGADPNGREDIPARTMADYLGRRFTPETAWVNRRAATPLLAALYTIEHPRQNSAEIQVKPHPNLAVIRALLEHGADVNAMDDTYIPPLSYAVRAGDVEIVDLMARHSGKLNEQHAWGSSLTEAASMGRTKMMRYLLDHGADVNATNGAGETALMDTVRYARQPDCVRLLLERHSHVNAKDRSGKTALWYAQNPHQQLSSKQTQHLPEIITMLKAAGAK